VNIVNRGLGNTYCKKGEKEEEKSEAGRSNRAKHHEHRPNFQSNSKNGYLVAVVLEVVVGRIW